MFNAPKIINLVNQIYYLVYFYFAPANDVIAPIVRTIRAAVYKQNPVLINENCLE